MSSRIMGDGSLSMTDGIVLTSSNIIKVGGKTLPLWVPPFLGWAPEYYKWRKGAERQLPFICLLLDCG